MKTISSLRVEAERNNSPATFVTWAELSRKANKLELELEDLKENRMKENSKPWRQNLKTIIRFSWMLLLFAIYSMSDYFSKDDGLISFEALLLFPFGSSRVVVTPTVWCVLCLISISQFTKHII